MNITKLTINLKTWARGKRKADPWLLDDDGKMCCLGFLGETCGIDKNQLLNKGLPEDVLTDKWPERVLLENDWVGDAVALNDLDSRKISLKDRMKQLKAHFKKIGITLSFKK